MFRIAFMVEDKSLAKVLQGLAGNKTFNLEVAPVANAEPAKGGKVKDAGRGTMIGAFEQFAKGKSEFRTKELAVYFKAAGFSESSTPSFLTEISKNKVIKKKAKGLWTITAKDMK